MRNGVGVPHPCLAKLEICNLTFGMPLGRFYCGDSALEFFVHVGKLLFREQKRVELCESRKLTERVPGIRNASAGFDQILLCALDIETVKKAFGIFSLGVPEDNVAICTHRTRTDGKGGYAMVCVYLS